MKVLKAGCVLVNIQNQKIGLIYGKDRKEYSFPKGHLEKGETLLECAIRETEEETSRKCHVVSEKEIGIVRYITPIGEDVECYMYLAIDDGESRKEIDEGLKEELVWTDFSKVKELLSYDDLKDFWNSIKKSVLKELNKGNKLSYEEMKEDELKYVLDLVKDVFNEFEAPDYTQEGINSFYKFANYENLIQLLQKNMKIIVTKIDNKIIGMICYRDFSHISMLFVDKKYHRQGIAKNLVNKMEEACKQNNEKLKEITVNSSPYAVEFYHKVGFENISEEQIADGIRFTPMKKKIK